MALVLAGCAGGAGADVVFIVDTNADVTIENFQVMKDFIKGIVREWLPAHLESFCLMIQPLKL